MINRFLLILAIILPPIAHGELFPNVQKYTLANGLTILLSEDHSLPLVSVAMMMKVGSKNETSGITGIAHFIEHLAFRNTKNFPDHQNTTFITDHGGRWTGYTWIDQTYYATTIAKEYLNQILAIELDRLTAVTINQQTFGDEKGSVLTELYSYSDPYTVLYDAVAAAALERHPYRNNGIGWASDVSSFTWQDASDFYKQYYTPENAVLGIVGDFKTEDVLKTIKTKFEPLTHRVKKQNINTLEEKQMGMKSVNIFQESDPVFIAAFHAPELQSPDFFTMVVTDALLSGGKGMIFTDVYAADPRSELVKRFKALNMNLATDWQASFYPYLYIIRIDPPKPMPVDEVADLLFKELNEIKQRSWLETELKKAKNTVLKQVKKDIATLPDRVHQLCFFEVSGGVEYFLNIEEKINAVTVEDVKQLMNDYLTENQATVGWIGPQQKNKTQSIKRFSSNTKTNGSVHRKAVQKDQNVWQEYIVPGNNNELEYVMITIPLSEQFVDYKWFIKQLLDSKLQEAGDLLDTDLILEEKVSANGKINFIVKATILESEHEVFRQKLLTLLHSLSLLKQSTFLQIQATSIKASMTRMDELTDIELSNEVMQILSSLVPDNPLLVPNKVPEKYSTFVNIWEQFNSPDNIQIFWVGNQDQENKQKLFLPKKNDDVSIDNKPITWTKDWTTIHMKDPELWEDKIIMLWPVDFDQNVGDLAEALIFLMGETGYGGKLAEAVVYPGLVYSIYASLVREPNETLIKIETEAMTMNAEKVLTAVRQCLVSITVSPFSIADLSRAKEYLNGKSLRKKMDSSYITDELFGIHSEFNLPVNHETLGQLNSMAAQLFEYGQPLVFISGPVGADH